MVLQIKPIQKEPIVTWEALPADFILPDDPVENIQQPSLAAALTDALGSTGRIQPQMLIGSNFGLVATVNKKIVVKAPDWLYVPQVQPVGTNVVRRSYTPNLEGAAVAVVMEFLSDTEGGELSIRSTPPYGKLHFYEKILQIPTYVTYDPYEPSLEVRCLHNGEYSLQQVDENGHFWIPELELFLGIWQGERLCQTMNWLRWWDKEGNLLLWSSEQAEQERQRAEQEHSVAFYSVAISPDGKTLASGSTDKTIKLWNLATGQEIRTLTGHSTTVISVAISPDGKTLASSNYDNNIKLWNLADGQEIRTLTGHSSWVLSVAISPDGKTLASGSTDKTIKLWNLATGQEIRTFTGHSNSLISVAISPDGKTLVSGSSDKTIKLWNLATGQEIRTLKGHSGSVWSVAISPDGKTLASGSNDKTIKLWNLATGQEIRTLTGHYNWIRSVAISPDGKTLASGSDDKTIKIWRLR